MGTFSARNRFFLPPESSAMAKVVPSPRIATKEFATIIKIERGGEEDPVIDHKLFGGKNAAPRGKSPKSKCQIVKHRVFIFFTTALKSASWRRERGTRLVVQHYVLLR